MSHGDADPARVRTIKTPFVGRKYGSGATAARKATPVQSVGRYAHVHYDEHGRKRPKS